MGIKKISSPSILSAIRKLNQLLTKEDKLRILNRIYNSNVNLCKFKLLTPNIFRINKIKRSYEVNSKYLKTKFINVYAIII